MESLYSDEELSTPNRVDIPILPVSVSINICVLEKLLRQLVTKTNEQSSVVS